MPRALWAPPQQRTCATPRDVSGFAANVSTPPLRAITDGRDPGEQRGRDERTGDDRGPEGDRLRAVDGCEGVLGEFTVARPRWHERGPLLRGLVRLARSGGHEGLARLAFECRRRIGGGSDSRRYA